MNLMTRNISWVQGLFIIFLILALALTFLYLYDPYEKARLARDKKRIEDLESLKMAIDIYLKNNPGEEVAMCDGCSLGRTVFATGRVGLDTFLTLNVATSSAVNITGWVPIDFSFNAKIGKTPIKVLPLDTVNLDPYVYTYTPGENSSYKLTVALESEQNNDLEKDDSGINDERFEIGSDLSLPP